MNTYCSPWHQGCSECEKTSRVLNYTGYSCNLWALSQTFRRCLLNWASNSRDEGLWTCLQSPHLPGCWTQLGAHLFWKLVCAFSPLKMKRIEWNKAPLLNRNSWLVRDKAELGPFPVNVIMTPLTAFLQWPFAGAPLEGRCAGNAAPCPQCF